MESPTTGPATRNASGLLAWFARQRYVTVLCFGVLLVLGWVTWTSNWDSGLYGDAVEQFVWSHSVELGYYKHPPLPTWLFALAARLLGPHWWLANALAAVCVAATGFFTWLIARRLCGERVANIAIVLWSLQQCFSVSAEIYNHNTVLVLCLSATTWVLLRALDSKSGLVWWIAAGFLAACAMLTKYQAGLPLAALLLATCLVSRKRGTQIIWQLAVAALVFFVVFGPHLYWGVINRFPSLRYASEVLESGGLSRRFFWVATFAVNQIRMVLPLLIAVLMCAGLAMARKKPATADGNSHSGAASREGETSIWLWTLVWGPIAVLIAVSLLTGSALRNHWGVQLFQFLPIWIAWRWRNSPALAPRNLIVAAVAVHVLGLTYYAVRQSDPNAVLADRRADSAYPAQKMSDAAVAQWKAATRCPLRIVSGDFEAGLVSAYSKEFPAVFTAPVATPWVTPEDVTRYGTLYVFDSVTPLPPEAGSAVRWTLAAGEAGNNKYVQFAVRLPVTTCK